MVSVTLDTNVLVEHWCNQHKAAVTKSVLDLAKHGKIELAITSRINADIPRLPLADRINELPVLNVQQIGSAFRFDVSRWDGGDMWGSDDFSNVMALLDDELDRQGRTKSRPDWKDWDHLHGHFLSGREVFLTWDCPILVLATELKERLGIVVETPEDFLSSHTGVKRNSQ